MITDFIYAREHVKMTRTWLVILVPEDKIREARETFSALANGYAFGGRTIRLTGGGRLSLVSASNEVFVPKDTPFDIMLLGWGGSTEKDTQELARWRTASRSLVTRGF